MKGIDSGRVGRQIYSFIVLVCMYVPSSIHVRVCTTHQPLSRDNVVIRQSRGLWLKGSSRQTQLGAHFFDVVQGWPSFYLRYKTQKSDSFYYILHVVNVSVKALIISKFCVPPVLYRWKGWRQGTLQRMKKRGINYPLTSYAPSPLFFPSFFLRSGREIPF